MNYIIYIYTYCALTGAVIHSYHYECDRYNVNEIREGIPRVKNAKTKIQIYERVR